tara:strand:+ start:22291 stop:23250 length:960 start_codon:yes stop_codon:yes gene_type:complete
MEKILKLKTSNIVALLGVGDSNLKLIEKAYLVKLVVRGNIIKINGEQSAVEKAKEVLHEMLTTLGSRGDLTKNDVQKLISLIKSPSLTNSENLLDDEDVIFYGNRGSITSKTDGQKKYAKLLGENDVVFSIGPAGTGKTFLAVAFAIAALKNHEVDQIVLCRPAVEAGESLGFLPGDLMEKVDPYFAPLYDALGFMLSEKDLRYLLNDNIIEIIPLAYMRGRTLDNAFMILDEAQNATIMQMKMFLTRLGNHSKAIVTGDITQIDLQRRKSSGLVQVVDILKNVEGIGFATLKDKDVVRHPLVRKIIHAYDNHQKLKTQ